MIKFHKFKFFVRRIKSPKHFQVYFFVFLIFISAFVYISFFVIPPLFAIRYNFDNKGFLATTTEKLVAVKSDVFVATHVATPKSVKALYMTSWVAGSKDLRSKLVKIIDTTELNSVVIDIKDYTGRISFKVEDPYLKEIGAFENRIPDAREFIADLHKKGIYVIGRISVFQDPHLVDLKPELAVRKKSDGGIWKDYKGISWIDAGSKEAWMYAVAIGKEAYKAGFDELNFDYVRFPSDGNMKDISYPESGIKPKPEVLRNFFAYLNQNLKPTGAVLSADLFGMTTTNTDDLNIGQVLENALPYFDYVAPMVYPSHYPPYFMGFAKPAEKPYEVIKFSMDAAVRRTVATSTVVALVGVEPIASTSPKLYPKESYPSSKIRPWIQDFSLGAVYTADMVRAQIKATYDSGLDSWMLWNASNRYTTAALISTDVSSAGN